MSDDFDNEDEFGELMPEDAEDFDDIEDEDDVEVPAVDDEKETAKIIEKNTVLTKEQEEAIALSMTEGKKIALEAALRVSCLELAILDILEKVANENDRIWRFLEDPREDGVGETSEFKAFAELKDLIKKKERIRKSDGEIIQSELFNLTGEDGELPKLTKRLSRDYLAMISSPDLKTRKDAKKRIDNAHKRREELFSELPYTIRIEFLDMLSTRFQEGLKDQKNLSDEDFINKYGTPKSEFQELSRSFFKGEYDFQKAREDLIVANQRLVIYFARKYQEQGVDLVDLIGEGNIGLLRAVERFDTGKGSRLATYATWWIKHNLNRAVANQGSTIRVPGHVREEKNRILKVSAEIQSSTGREATYEELSERLGIPIEKIHYILRRTQGTISIDKPLGHDEEDETLQKLLPDYGTLTPEEEVTRKLDKKWVKELLGELAPRERQIIELRYGLTGKDSMTLQEVGVIMKITRERVRQLQTKAEGKLFKLARKLGYFK